VDIIPQGAINHYTLELTTPGGQVRIPIESWQARLQVDVASYVQCVIPDASPWVDDINAATDFEIYRTGGGHPDVQMTGPRPVSALFTRGPHRHNCSISGNLLEFSSDPDPDPLDDRTLTGIRSTIWGSDLRVYCDIDFQLRPGHRAWAGDLEILVSYIQYNVTSTEAYMVVGEL
jgi:hypothetical protein